jgi:hypothetical protein
MFLSMNASITAFQIGERNFAALGADSESVGHICWDANDADVEWYQSSGRLCRANRSDVIDLTTGNRIGRPLTTVETVARYPELYKHLGQFVSLCQNGMGHFVGT